MKRFYYLSLSLFAMLFALTASAQREVVVETDPMNPTNLSDVINGDTMPTGERVDNNTVYKLQNGGVYLTSARIENTADWPIHIETVDLTTTAQAQKAIITRIPNASGDFQPVLWPSGDVTLKNLWIISGEKGVGENHDWGRMRFFGANSRVIVDNCIIEKDRGGFLQMRADSIKCYVSNSIFRNGGNRFILEGNGRGVDSRQFPMDTLIVKNTVIHNIVDRVFRSLGNVVPHNWIEFDHCTIFNQFGRHGGVVLEQTHNFKFTNNLWINPNMMGASPRYADEQNNPDNEVNKLFTLDTLVDPTNVIISNNNLFWTQDVRDVWAKHDTVSQPPVYSTLIQEAMGDTTGGYFSEEVALRNVPVRITEYLDDLYANPAAEDMFDVIVQDSTTAVASGRDFGNNFDFIGGKFDPCYDLEGTESATASTSGGPIGALSICGLMSTSIYEDEINVDLGLEVTPNPVADLTNITYDLERAGLVRVSIYDLTGRLVETLVNEIQFAGAQNVEWQAPQAMPNGHYLLRLQSQSGQMVRKLVVAH